MSLSSESFKKHVALLQQYTEVSSATAERHLTDAVEAKIDKDVSDDQFADALWRLHLVEDAERIERAVLSVSLLKYYLHDLRSATVDIPDALAFGDKTNPLDVLRKFSPHASAALNTLDYYSTKLQLISGLSKADAVRIVRSHKFKLVNALREASQGGILTPKMADAAFLSEMTGLNPVDARQAKGNLIESFQEQRDQWDGVKYQTMLLTAKLINFDVDVAGMHRIIYEEERGENGRSFEDIWLQISTRLTRKIFNIHTRTSDEAIAATAVREAGGDLTKAIADHNSRPYAVLAGHQKRDSAEPTDIHAQTAKLLAKYKSHKPETSNQDRELAQIIRQYEAGANHPSSAEILSRQLSFRLGKDEFALMIAVVMGLKYIPAVNEYDYNQERKNRDDSETYCERHKHVWANLVKDTTITWFDPAAGQGQPYYRPYYYLAHVLTINKCTDGNIRKRLSSAHEFVRQNENIETASCEVQSSLLAEWTKQAAH